MGFDCLVAPCPGPGLEAKDPKHCPVLGVPRYAVGVQIHGPAAPESWEYIPEGSSRLTELGFSALLYQLTENLSQTQDRTQESGVPAKGDPPSISISHSSLGLRLHQKKRRLEMRRTFGTRGGQTLGQAVQ